MISLDVESSSECNLLDCGAYLYARHPSTKLMCAVFLSDMFGRFDWLPGDPFPAWIAEYIRQGGMFAAFNANFERIMCRYVATPKHSWPVIQDSQWTCTAARCSALAMPKRLDHAGFFIGAPEQKDAAGKRLMMRLSTPNNKTGVIPVPTPEEKQQLVEYCAQDTESELSIAGSVRLLPPAEERVYRLDQKINDRGIYVDRELAIAALKMWEGYEPIVNAKVEALTGGVSGTQVGELKKWLSEQLGTSVTSLTKDSIRDMLEKQLPENVRQVLKLRQDVSASAVKKFKKFVSACGDDSRIRGTLKYHAAAPGRWGGRLIQPQNMLRPVIPKSDVPLAVSLVKRQDVSSIETLWGSVADVLGSLCRATMRATPGNRLICPDFNAIEARLVAWLAGQQDLLDAFAKDVKGEGPYERMASKIFKKPIRTISPYERFIGKTTVLGCGYAMGPDKFKNTLKIQYNVDITKDFAVTCVTGFREGSPDIKRFWSNIEYAMVRTVRTGQECQAGRVKFWKNGDWTYLRLPSGRDLAYYKCRVVLGRFDKPQVEYMGVDGQSDLPRRERTYGGKLLENCAQGIARDCLVHSMFQLEDKGYPIVSNVHDELLLDVPQGHGSLAEVLSVMSKPISWAPGLPIKAEGWEGEFYWKG